MKNLYFGFAALIGVILIVAIGLEFIPILGQEIALLNIVVVSICYLLVISPLFITYINNNDKSQSWVGTLGLTIFSSSIYTILALCIIFYCNYDTPPVLFRYQLYLHLALLLVFFVLRGTPFVSGDKVQEVYNEEAFKTNGVVEMKKAIGETMDAAAMCKDLPQKYLDQINEIGKNVRFISPIGTDESFRLEEQFTSQANDLKFFLNGGFRNRTEEVESQIRRLEITLKNRKQITA